MKTQIEPGELMQRIRREARRHERVAFPSTAEPESADVTEQLFVPPAPVLGMAQKSLLAQIGSMVDRARGKTTVDEGVPKLLRPLLRNQGGYNGIVLETLACLRESNRSLMADNEQLSLHIQRQAEWIQAAERRLAKTEKRLCELERQSGTSETTQER